jgi:hypothetical protein
MMTAFVLMYLVSIPLSFYMLVRSWLDDHHFRLKDVFFLGFLSLMPVLNLTVSSFLFLPTWFSDMFEINWNKVLIRRRY